MANWKGKSTACHIQLLMETYPDFPQRLKHRIVSELNKVENHFQFIAGLFAKEVLSDRSNDSEGNSLLKEMMVQHAIMIACSKDAGAIGGLMEAMEESGNFSLTSALTTWIKTEFAIDFYGDLSEPKGHNSHVDAPTSELIAKREKFTNELTSIGTKLIDKIMAHKETELMEQLEAHLLAKAPKIVNAEEFCSSLISLDVLDESDVKLLGKPRHELEAGSLTEQAIKAACSKKAIGSLVVAFQQSGNERIIQETYDWLETSRPRKKNHPISVKTLSNQRSQEEPKFVRSTFFEQAALPDELSKLATFKCQLKSATKGISTVQFDKERIMACATDGTLNLWNWRGKEESTHIAVNVENITCLQYDEEILVLGTSEGTVHLFDARSFEENALVGLGHPVTSLKFVESILVVLTRTAQDEKLWWMEISRVDKRFLNPRSLNSYTCFENQTRGVCMYSDIIFVYLNEIVYVYDTKSGNEIKHNKKTSCYLVAPYNISTLNVGDLSSKTFVVAGCIDGTIAIWSSSRFMPYQNPVKMFEGHSKAIVSVCFLNGNLLSLDQSGRLLMWSGHILENKKVTPVPRVLIEMSNLTSLAAHERCLASCSSQDDTINIWTVPDLWLRN